MVKGAISRYTAGQRELGKVGIHPRITKMRLQNGSLRSLLFQISHILKHPPWPATARSKSGAPLSIMVIVNGDFTGRMAIMNGKISKEISHMIDFQSYHQCNNLVVLPNEQQLGVHRRRRKECGWYSRHWFFSMSRLELLKWLIKTIYSPLLLYFYYFMMLIWPWI